MRLSENGYDLERTISFSDSLLFDGKTKEKENLSANIEQIGVFVQGRTTEKKKKQPKWQSYSRSNVFFNVKAGCDDHLQKRKILLDKSSQIGIKIK